MYTTLNEGEYERRAGVKGSKELEGDPPEGFASPRGAEEGPPAGPPAPGRFPPQRSVWGKPQGAGRRGPASSESALGPGGGRPSESSAPLFPASDAPVRGLPSPPPGPLPSVQVCNFCLPPSLPPGTS